MNMERYNKRTIKRKSLYYSLSIHLKKLTLTSILLVLSLILTRFFSPYIPLFGSNSFRIGFGTIPLMLCSILCGPLYGAACGFFADFLGAIIFPSGAYLFVFSVSSMLQGIFPYLILKLCQLNKNVKYFVYLFLSLLSLFIISLFIGINDYFNVGKNTFNLDIGMKFVVFFSFFGIFIILFICIYFISMKINKNEKLGSSCNVFDNFIVALFNEIVILVLIGSLWKQLFFNIPYAFCLFTSSVLMIPNVLVKGTILSLITKRLDNSLFTFERRERVIKDKRIYNMLSLKKI